MKWAVIVLIGAGAAELAGGGMVGRLVGAVARELGRAVM